MKLAAMALVGLVLCGCGNRPAYYRQDVRPDYILWREVHPTTFHGICASVIGSDTGKLWDGYHPYGHYRNDDGSIGSAVTEEKSFNTKADALAWAESVCPTTKVSVTK